MPNCFHVEYAATSPEYRSFTLSSHLAVMSTGKVTAKQTRAGESIFPVPTLAARSATYSLLSLFKMQDVQPPL